MAMIASSYLRPMFDQHERDTLLEYAENTLDKIDFQIIAVTGVSGLIFGTLLADTLGKGLLVVRKRGESCHSRCVVEGNLPEHGDKILLVDDFISSGKTVVTMLQEIQEALGDRWCIKPGEYEIAGYYSWNHSYFMGYRETADRVCPGSWSNLKHREPWCTLHYYPHGRK